VRLWEYLEELKKKENGSPRALVKEPIYNKKH
jgi:hypothetical protein